jgi:exodeoxyribonuclease V gamma subunit
VLVSELLDAVDAVFTFPPHNGQPQTAADALTLRPPRHPVSPGDVKRGNRLHSFSRPYYAVAQALFAPPAPPPTSRPASRPAPPATVALADLVAFFRSPSHYFYTKRLGVHLDLRDDEQPDDEEPLEPDSFAIYRLKQDLLGALERGAPADTPDRLRTRWEIAGRLPAGTGKHVAAAEVKIRELIEKKDALHLGAPLGPRPLDLALENGVRLQGSLDALYGGDAQLFTRPADERPKDTVAAWLHHLAACAHGLAVTTHGVYTKPRAYYAPFPPVAPDTARRILAHLTNLFADGLTRPLCFDPAIGKKWIDGKGLSDADWTGSPFLPGSGVDAYLRRAFGDTLPEPDSPALQTLADTAHALFDDMPKPPKKRTSRKPVPPS